MRPTFSSLYTRLFVPVNQLANLKELALNSELIISSPLARQSPISCVYALPHLRLPVLTLVLTLERQKVQDRGGSFRLVAIKIR